MRGFGCAAVCLALALGFGCGEDEVGEGDPAALARIVELKRLGLHAEADAIVAELGATEVELPPESYRETLDAGDDPLTPGCVCCYSDAQCSTVQGRSVDECHPPSGDDLSENVAPTGCTQGAPCAKRKPYKCSEVLAGSSCETVELDCCGVATTSAYCKPVDFAPASGG